MSNRFDEPEGMWCFPPDWHAWMRGVLEEAREQQAAIAELVEVLEYAQDSIHKTYCEDACEVVEAECCSDCIHLQTLIAKHKAGE